MKKKLITVLTILINVALLPPTIHAYELNGQAWTSTDISDLDYKIYTGCDHYSYIVTISEYAATSWEDIVDGDTPDWNRITSGDYEVYITDYEEQSGVLGYAYVYGNPINDAIIYINDYQIDISYYQDSNHFQWVICHEMGHVQGLAHETDYYNIVMYPYDSAYIEFGVYTPQADDQNGIIAIYG